MGFTNFMLIVIFLGCPLHASGSVTSNRILTYFSDGKVTWNHGVELCLSLNGRLVTFDSEDVHTAVKTFRNGVWSNVLWGDFWTGLHNTVASNTPVFAWQGSCAPQGTYQPWLEIEFPSAKRCVEGDSLLMAGTVLETEECSDRSAHALCERNGGDCHFIEFYGRGVSGGPYPPTQEILVTQTSLCEAACLEYTEGPECWGYTFEANLCYLYHDDSGTAMKARLVTGLSTFYHKMCFSAEINTDRLIPRYLNPVKDKEPWSGCNTLAPSPSAPQTSDGVSPLPTTPSGTFPIPTAPLTDTNAGSTGGPIHLINTTTAKVTTIGTSVNSGRTHMASYFVEAQKVTISTIKTNVPRSKNTEEVTTYTTSDIDTNSQAYTLSEKDEDTSTLSNILNGRSTAMPLSVYPYDTGQPNLTITTELQVTAEIMLVTPTTESAPTLTGWKSESKSTPRSNSKTTLQPATHLTGWSNSLEDTTSGELDITTYHTSGEPGASCCHCKTVPVYSEPEKRRFIAQLLSTLTLNKTRVSANQRRYNSAKDSRLSAMAMGFMGIVIMSVFFVCIIIADIKYLVRDIRHSLLADGDEFSLSFRQKRRRGFRR